MERPVTTLFMLESLDGKINSGNSDALDVDRDWKVIPGLKEGLQQYYDLESETDTFSLNTGRVMAKIGVNEREEEPEKMDAVTFVIIDNAPHLNERGVGYLCRWTGRLILVTTNKEHPAYKMRESHSNLDIFEYEDLDLAQVLADVHDKYGAERLTIQSGGNMNGQFLRDDLIDYVNIVVAPVLVGGRDTSTLIDGEAISSPEELDKIRPMKLIECKALNDSYVQLRYEVMHR
ncbi:dihydrofolate reductase family protein [Candidatus Saccharibacteria bacterium]|nr:dihydrofolate reductase family protein [Candidatus Saccharibacteria bacterium]